MPAARSTEELARDRTDLALERTVMAADRTLMAWVRTALTMVGFGFTIFKFLQTVEGAGQAIRPNEARNIGLALVGMGITSLLFASVQYIAQMKRFGQTGREARRNLTLWVAGMVGLFGVLALLDIGWNAGPF